MLSPKGDCRGMRTKAGRPGTLDVERLRSAALRSAAQCGMPHCGRTGHDHCAGCRLRPRPTAPTPGVARSTGGAPRILGRGGDGGRSAAERGGARPANLCRRSGRGWCASRALVHLVGADTPLRLDENSVTASTPLPSRAPASSISCAAASTSSARCVGRSLCGLPMSTRGSRGPRSISASQMPGPR